jgi:hypothetical protein
MVLPRLLHYSTYSPRNLRKTGATSEQINTTGALVLAHMANGPTIEMENDTTREVEPSQDRIQHAQESELHPRHPTQPIVSCNRQPGTRTRAYHSERIPLPSPGGAAPLALGRHMLSPDSSCPVRAGKINHVSLTERTQVAYPCLNASHAA